MADGISASGQEFVGNLEEMVRRLERVERIVRLLAASVLPYAATLQGEAFHKYLEARCSDEWNDTLRQWKAGSQHGEFIHKPTSTVVQLPSQWDDDGSGNALIECLLTIASFEGRMPARVLADIQPSAFPSAVDALVIATQESPE